MGSRKQKGIVGSKLEIIAGVDEAGRGPLAGPVVAAAVILQEDHGIEGLADSKKLTSRRRESLFSNIMDKALSVGIGVVDAEDIDKLNILKATQKAMRMALGRLRPTPTKALIDGYALPDQVIPNEGIINGDNKVESIMAASIIAKVSRDRIMEVYDIIFPEYHFKKHKGYGTAAHMEVLKNLKATPIHRKSFNPVKENFPTLNWLRKEKCIGKLGEQLAAMNYMDKGYVIKCMNQTCSHYGEIDLIAEKDGELVFVEVKTVSKNQLGALELKVDRQKLIKLERAILYYLGGQSEEWDIRLDVMTVVLGKGKPILKQFKGVSLD